MTRPTRRDVEKRLDDLDDDGGDYPQAGLAIALSSIYDEQGDVEIVDSDRWLWRIDGELHRIRPAAQEKIEDLLGACS